MGVYVSPFFATTISFGSGKTLPARSNKKVGSALASLHGAIGYGILARLTRIAWCSGFPAYSLRPDSL